MLGNPWLNKKSVMKFKISLSKEAKHKGIVVCVSWNNTEDVFSCADDHKLLKWNLVSGECFHVTTFPEDFYPTGMQLFPKGGMASSHANNKHSGEVLLLTTADGKFHIVNQNGRIDKSVVAHQGACLAGQWSPDGAGLLTAGEDGLIKVWSRNGLLRSCVVQSDIACYSAVWSPDSNAILYTKRNIMIIKQLNSNAKEVKWKAHEGLILCVAWNANNNMILSGGEDGYFKVWDVYGQQLSSSVKHDQSIMALSWSPAGDMFVVASYNLLRLCNVGGWSLCLDRPSTGGIQSVAWSMDGTQLAAACSNGYVLFAHIIDRQFSWKNYSCTVSGRKAITMKDVNTDTTDQLDYPERVIHVRMGYGHLVVATVKQCSIHTMHSWNTPVVFDLKEGTVTMILLSERCFCVVERSTVSVYSYAGRLLTSPRWQNMRPDTLRQGSLTLAPDTLAVVDQTDAKVIHILELPSGLSVRAGEHTSSKVQHHCSVSRAALSQSGPASHRQLAVLDCNRDLYVLTLKHVKLKFLKLDTQMLGMVWSSECEILAGLRSEGVVAWCCPAAAHDWQAATTLRQEISDLGRNPYIASLEDGVAQVYRSNGSLLHISLVPFPEKLLKYVAADQWQSALKLCRTVEDETLWACLAVLAWQNRELDVAEEAFALIKHYHQVEYIQHLKNSTPEKISKSNA